MTKDDAVVQVVPVIPVVPVQVAPVVQVVPVVDDRAALIRDLTGLVRRVPGVATVYASGPLVGATLSAVTQVVVRGDLGVDLVSVSEANGGLVVSVTIGVNEGMPATQVCRQVYDAIAEHLVAGGATQPATIAVKVGRIG